MRLQDQPSIMETARNLARTYQFKMEPWWLLQAALGTGVRGMDSFGNLNLQKFLIREIRMWDYIANGGNTYWNDSMARWIVPQQQRFTIAPRRRGGKAAKSGGAANGDQSKRMEDQTLEELRLNSDEEDIEPDNELDNENENEDGEDELEDDGEGIEGESSNLTQQDTRPREHVRHAPWKKPEDREPAFWLMYGQALLTAKSFQSSICESASMIPMYAVH
jgi:general transcription factor 3C polypeptide 3 (transcription factor C subunit 4)